MSPAERRFRQRLAANVRQLRTAQGMTVEEAAGRAGMHWRHLQKIEAGEVNATLRTLARLADALGAPGGQLLE
jgi:transcriptional regulator with XRE-family HTH domain